jgi:tetratricopeptide (TPR) repeat protein
MKVLRRCVAALLLYGAVPAALAETKAWQDTVTLPTWLEGPPETAPRLDALDPDRSLYKAAYYPYATRTNFLKKQEPQQWRRLNLENEYLLCSFLPDLGGRLYSCTDKLNGRPVFQASPSIKKAWVAVRGAWVELGIEWNFPVAHSRDTVSPVNFAIRQEKGQAEVWLGDIDRVTGMEWLAQFVLRDGSAVLEQHVTLRNPTEALHPYLWWANASVALDQGTRFAYPVRVMATHGTAELQPWPRDSAGTDESNLANDKESVGLFGYGSREPFIAVYQASTRTASVHVADPAVVTGKKLWTWGLNSQWARSQLSDSNSLSVEMQAGLFPNQETYGRLQPHAQIQFTELWMAGRNLSGVTRANAHAILSLERQNTAGKSALTVELNVTHAIAGAHIRVLNGRAAVLDETADLTPAPNYVRSLPDPVKGAYRFELRDGAGTLLMAHTEGVYETVGPSSVSLGPQVQGEAKRETPSGYLAAGEYFEDNSQFRMAEEIYRDGLAKTPNDLSLLKALGRFLATRRRYAESLQPLSQAAAVWQLDPELRYYLGLALSRSGQDDAARKSWAIASADARFGSAALVEMAAMDARAGHNGAALDGANRALARNHASLTARRLQVALLRLAGKRDAALQRLEEARAIDPADSFLRLEAVQLGGQDEGLWQHLGADPERVLDIAETYFDFGMYRDAMTVLDRMYRPVPANQTEPGSVLPQDYPLVAYYRAYCRRKLGEEGAADFKLASSQRLEYVFPNRAGSVAVLQAAIHEDPQDASAHFLLGLLYLDANSAGDSIAELQAARAIRKDIPELYFVLARAFWRAKEGKGAAVSLLREGVQANPSNQELKSLLAEAIAPPKAASAQPGSAGTGSAGAGGKKPAAPAELAASLLSRAALGDNSAAGSFNAENFPQDKQPDSVRQIYIELQLQALRRLMADHKCGEALPRVETIGNEDQSLPFTLYGFDEWMKGARFQYYLGAIEAGCGDQRAARRRWAKVAKMNAPVSSPDFAFPLVAAQNLASKGRGPDAQPLIDKADAALAQTDADKGVLLYSKGILLLANGDEQKAFAAFQQGADAGGAGMSHYLNALALHEAQATAGEKR